MADKKINTKELQRQRLKREQQRQLARQKYAENDNSKNPKLTEPKLTEPKLTEPKLTEPELTEPEQAGKPTDQTKPKLNESQITGLKYFDKLAPLLERLRDEACDRDKAGNRELHYDQDGMLTLLDLFNPVVTSLRGIQQASELEKGQQKRGTSRTSLGSLSESARGFDAERLKEIIAELGAELKPLGRDSRLSDIDKTLVLVEGSLISALPSIMEASWRKQTTGSGLVKWRLHTHFEVDRYVPTRIDVTPNDGGEHDERAVFERTIEADRLYVLDRGDAKFALFNKIVKANSRYVCRLREVFSAHQPWQIQGQLDRPRPRRDPANRDESS